MSSISLSFLQSACSYSNLHLHLHHQQKLFVQPPLISLSSSSSQWRRSSLTVEASARTRQDNRKARHVRIRKKVEGTPERPRLCVFRSNKHLYVQVIDDTKMHTLASASTKQKPLSEEFDYSSGPTILMERFDKKRSILKTWKGTIVPNAKMYLNKISKNLGEFEVCRSGEYRAEVKYKGRRWEVSLDEQQCTCRVWQVKGLPCYHAATFIAFTRGNWDEYVDLYFTIDKYKAAYALEIAPMPEKDQWVRTNPEEKIYPPSIKRPSGRPRKNRIKSHDESRKRHKCSRCGEYGHHGKTCKNSIP